MKLNINNETYIPSDYKHVQVVLQKATERTLEELLSPDWKEEINRRIDQRREGKDLLLQ